MSNISCEIITIGDELLIGQVVNTNASWMAAELNKSGISVHKITTISDDGEEIKNALTKAEEQSNIILLTGGLGPTNDDITKNVLAEYFDSGFTFHEPTFEHIKSLFKLRSYQVTEVNKQQASIPEACKPIFNSNGTAPGMWFEKNGKVIVSMPGVPFEMKGLMQEEIIPLLQKSFNTPNIFHKTIMTTGIGESMLASIIEDVENNLPPNIKLGYLPQPGIVRLRLSASGENRDQLIKDIEYQSDKLTDIIPDLIFGYDDIKLEEVIGDLLKESSASLSTAESCTGGYIAHLLTSIPGSSEYFEGSVVSYSNEIKIKQLNVNPESIEKHGAVSREVVEQMAIGGRNTLGTDYCIATSGIAGPNGGTEEKPVGTVWIALAKPEKVISKLYHLGEHRGRNIRRSALLAMNMLRLELVG